MSELTEAVARTQARLCQKDRLRLLERWLEEAETEYQALEERTCAGDAEYRRQIRNAAREEVLRVCEDEKKEWERLADFCATRIRALKEEK